MNNNPLPKQHKKFGRAYLQWIRTIVTFRLKSPDSKFENIKWRGHKKLHDLGAYDCCKSWNEMPCMESMKRQLWDDSTKVIADQHRAVSALLDLNCDGANGLSYHDLKATGLIKN